MRVPGQAAEELPRGIKPEEMDAFDQQRGDDAHRRQDRHQRGPDEERHDEGFRHVAGAEIGPDTAERQGQAAKRDQQDQRGHGGAARLAVRTVGFRRLEDGRGHVRPDSNPDIAQPRADVAEIGAHRGKVALAHPGIGHDQIQPVGDPAHIGHDQRPGTAIGNIRRGQQGGRPVFHHDGLDQQPGHQHQKRWDGGEKEGHLSVETGQGMQLSRVAARHPDRPRPADDIARHRQRQNDQKDQSDTHVTPPRQKTGRRKVTPPGESWLSSAAPSAFHPRSSPASPPAPGRRRGHRPPAGRPGLPSRPRRRTRRIPSGRGSRRYALS